MRRDVYKWNFDVCTDQIKIEGRKGAAHNAGTAVYQVVGAIINSDTINYFLLIYWHFINYTNYMASVGRSIMNCELGSI
jgi:hypothetical protein